MIVLDTCAMIFDALDPGRMGRRASRALDAASAKGVAACSDISLWEIAMLSARGRLDSGTDGGALTRPGSGGKTPGSGAHQGS